MTLLQLHYFQTLAHCLHYTHAAELLHISQPSLSYAIGELEKELGVKLFEKERRKITLTLYGQQFLPYAERSLDILKEGTDLLNQLASNSPQIIRLGYFHSVSASLIPSVIENFYHQNEESNIRFHFTEAPSYDILSLIRSGSLDMGFSVHQADWAESVGVVRQPLYLAVPSRHPLAASGHVSFRDFAKEPMIMLERGSNLRAKMDHLFSQEKLIPNIVFEVRECNAALQYVGLGFGVSVLPQVPAMDSDKVSILPIADHEKEFVRTVYFTYAKKHSMSPAAQIIKDYIIQHFSLEVR